MLRILVCSFQPTTFDLSCRQARRLQCASHPGLHQCDFWNISCSSDEISVASSLRILGDMLSDPGALYGFSCFSNFVIPLQVMSKDFIFGCCVVVEFMRFEFRNSSTTSKNMAFEAINNNLLYNYKQDH